MQRPIRLALALAFSVAVALVGAGATTSALPSANSVRYTISLAGAATHILHVRLELPAGSEVRELQLPVWNALYEVRDFSQFVNWIQASAPDGHALPLRKLNKSRWQVSGLDQGGHVDYELFADTSGPYSAQLNAHHAFFNLADILMYPVDARSASMTVRFTDLPPGWRIATALKSSGDIFTAENYDRLVDSPFEIGLFKETDFDVAGAHYRVVVDADPADYDMQKIVPVLQRIVAAETTWMNDCPFQEYLFIYHFPRETGGGGMEHAFSTAIDLNADVLRANFQALIGVTAHEFFHLWNVKRIRPQSLEPVDYTEENYTTALWFSEGFTSTVGDYALLQAGLQDETLYLSRLSEQITNLQRRPAHLTQSAEESSLDAWLEKYPYYRLPLRSISYYNKGQLLGVLLDLEIREKTQGQASLRDLFQWMNTNLAQQGTFFDDSKGVRHAAETVCHCDLAEFFARYVAGRDELPYDRLFATVGLRLKKQAIIVGDLGFAATRNFDAPPLITTLDASSAAARAGLAVGDSVLLINGQPVGSDFEDRLGALRPDSTLKLRVRNAAGEKDVQWKVGAREELEFALKDVENVSAQQRARRSAWLRGESQKDARP